MKKLMVLLLTVSMLGTSLMITSCGSKSKKSALVGEGSEAQEQKADEKSEDKKEEAKKSEDKKDSKKEDKKDDKKADTKADTKSDTKSESKESGSSNSTASEEEEVKVTPTFMYFVSKQDADHDKTMEIVEELKKKYKGKVNFDITDIDENPEAKENFPVEGQTPMLIMLDTSNNISMMPQKITDKAKLEEAIENALGE